MSTGKSQDQLFHFLDEALSCRLPYLSKENPEAVRLFNGFVEGSPDLTVDIYGKTLLIQNYAKESKTQSPAIQHTIEFYTQSLPWIKAVVLKERNSFDLTARNGRVVWGSKIDDCIYENGIWYALNLLINSDASFYLDTRNLRQWAYENLAGKNALNTFAYTGSLGVAAKVGGAEQVIHIDQSIAFLNIAHESYRLNHLSLGKNDFIVGDFFRQVRRLKGARILFDCVFLDPPFFSVSVRGRIDLITQYSRLINKVRPLIAHNGWLVAVNNALFLPGESYYHTLQELSSDGYMSIESLLPVPADCTGYPTTIRRALPVDPSPFNHATKIAILRIKRKDQRMH